MICVSIGLVGGRGGDSGDDEGLKRGGETRGNGEKAIGAGRDLPNPGPRESSNLA